MNPTMNQQPMMGQGGNNMMESLKSNMMTMLMLNNMNGGSKTSGSGDTFTMVYIFIATHCQSIDEIVQ